MDCLSPEQLVSYVRGGSAADPRQVESHVRDCPACAMELLLVRETLAEGRAKAARAATDRFRSVSAKPRALWIPWVGAAAVLVAAVLFAVLSNKPAPAPIVKQQERPKVHVPPAPTPEIPKPEPKPIVPELPKPEPKPEPKPIVPEPPKPEPKPEPKPVVPEPPKPELKPEPKPEPKKPSGTEVEKAVVARVLHSVGGPASNSARQIRAGEALVTARAEFLDVQLDGYGRLFLRENTQAEIGLSGEVILREGEMLARLDPGKKLGSFKTPLATVEAQSPVFNVLATKTSAEVSILSGRVMVASAEAKGPSTVVVKSGKAPETRPLDAGFASWLPDKLAAKKFTGFFEAEDFTLQGFKALKQDGASSGQAAVQVADTGVIAYKGGLPFKGRHSVWLRVRQYEPKPTLIGIHVGGQSAGEVKLEMTDGKPWRWVGPIVVNGDRLDLAISALSRFPLKEGEGAAARSFPVVVDAIFVTTDAKLVPPDRIGDDARLLDLVLDDPVK